MTMIVTTMGCFSAENPMFAGFRKTTSNICSNTKQCFLRRQSSPRPKIWPSIHGAGVLGRLGCNDDADGDADSDDDDANDDDADDNAVDDDEHK